MRRILSRISLVFGVGVVVVVMMAGGISLAGAQEAPESGGPTCSDMWLRDWFVSEDWLYYWWFRYCQDPNGEWFKAYHSWRWHAPVLEAE